MLALLIGHACRRTWQHRTVEGLRTRYDGGRESEGMESVLMFTETSLLSSIRTQLAVVSKQSRRRTRSSSGRDLSMTVPWICATEMIPLHQLISFPFPTPSSSRRCRNVPRQSHSRTH
jgi:hypothetical protein